MEIQIAIAKIPKAGSPESGDSLEFIERPNGGVSVVLSDGLNSGAEAKAISASVVRKVINLLGEGVRDSAAARAASDFLFTEKSGKSAAYLDILSIDLQTDTIVLSRNNPNPCFIARGDIIESLGEQSQQIGTSRNIKPATREIPLEPGIIILLCTDGIQKAGYRIGQPVDIHMLLESLLEDQEPSPQEIANTILGEAVRLDQGMPDDDMSLVVLRIVANKTNPIRRMVVNIPFDKAMDQIEQM
jgi:serine phosphatase RsbU (regulator of sigma subunit)